jgi:hypothetical protein
MYTNRGSSRHRPQPEIQLDKLDQSSAFRAPTFETMRQNIQLQPPQRVAASERPNCARKIGSLAQNSFCIAAAKSTGILDPFALFAIPQIDFGILTHVSSFAPLCKTS